MNKEDIHTKRYIHKKIYTHNGMLLSQKKKILPLARVYMDLDVIMLSEISQIEKEKYYMLSLKCGI